MAEEKNEVYTNLDELPLINNKDAHTSTHTVEGDVNDVDAAVDNNPPSSPPTNVNVLRQRKRLKFSEPEGDLVSSGEQLVYKQKGKDKKEEKKDKKKYEKKEEKKKEQKKYEKKEEKIIEQKKYEKKKDEIQELVKSYQACRPHRCTLPPRSLSCPSASSSFQFQSELALNDPEAVQSNADECRHFREMVELEWAFITTNLVLEILLVVLDQLASPQNPNYSLTAFVLSIIAIAFSLFELYFKARKQGVAFKREGLRFSFGDLSSTSTDKQYLYSFTDVFGFICALCQFIFSAVAYSFHRRHANNPINISIVSLVFILCLAISKLTNHTQKIPIS